MESYDTPVQAIEPFLWTFGDGTAVLLSSMLLLLLFSDLPKMTPVTPYQLIRTTKRKWLLGQFVYITVVTILYTFFTFIVGKTFEHLDMWVDLFFVSIWMLVDEKENINIENKKETIPSLIGIVLGLLLQYFI